MCVDILLSRSSLLPRIEFLPMTMPCYDSHISIMNATLDAICYTESVRNYQMKLIPYLTP